MLDKKLLDLSNILFGLWLIVSPWVLGFAADTGALRSVVLFGAAIIVVALWALYRPRMRGPEWVNAALGVLLFLTPWAMAYRGDPTAAWNAWVLGIVIVAIAAYTFLPRMRLPEGTHQPHAH